MNKIVASLGIAALGASSIQTVCAADDLGVTTPKIWSISGSLRGFYDDNINGTASNEVSSVGFEVSPGVTLKWANAQTSANLDYIYSYRWFEKERFVDAGHNSQTHLFRGNVDHAFSERYSVGVIDWFAIGQEPDLQRNPAYGVVSLPYPVPGDNIHNYGAVNFNAQMTPIFGVEVGYANSFYDYEDANGRLRDVNPLPGTNNVDLVFFPSLSALFDRIEQTAHINFTWKAMRQTTAFIGYQYGWINYTADEPLTDPLLDPDATFQNSSDHDNYSHYAYVGATHVFMPNLMGSVTAGGRFITFREVDDTDASPYVRAMMRYIYWPESYVEAGFSYDLNMVGLAQAQSAQTALLYVNVRHRIIPKFFANLVGQAQNSTIVGGPNNDADSRYYTVGVNLEYQITPCLAVNAGYDFDDVDSEIGTDYTRNRVYFGITGSY